MEVLQGTVSIENSRLFEGDNERNLYLVVSTAAHGMLAFSVYGNITASENIKRNLGDVAIHPYNYRLLYKPNAGELVIYRIEGEEK